MSRVILSITECALALASMLTLSVEQEGCVACRSSHANIPLNIFPRPHTETSGTQTKTNKNERTKRK